MYPKYFFERFWEGEQKNQLFVCMPFEDSFDEKFKAINKATEKTSLKEAKRVKENTGTSVITDEILDGIANSKFLLFDLSNDPKYGKKCPNPNVIYELGIAIATREPTDIIIIKNSSEDIKELPFDVKSIRVHKHPSTINEEILKAEIEKSLKAQEWYKSKRVRAAAESIDETGLRLMLLNGIIPEEFGGHFSFGHPKITSIPERIAAHRLMDLGILWFDTGKSRNPAEYAYHWSSFGREVMKYLGIEQFSLEKFIKEKPAEYQVIKKANEEWAKNQKKED